MATKNENNKIKVLLIEDDPTLIEMYQLKFKESGFDFKVCNRGAEGLAASKKDKPDVILLDVILPEMDGFAILTELKKDAKTKSVPVLLLTNLGQESDIKKGKQLGAVDYLVKANFTPAEVVDKIKKLINKK